MQEMQVQFLGQEDLLDKEVTTRSSILARKIPWGAWWATVHGVAKSQTWLSEDTCTAYSQSGFRFWRRGSQKFDSSGLSGSHLSVAPVCQLHFCRMSYSLYYESTQRKEQVRGLCGWCTWLQSWGSPPRLRQNARVLDPGYLFKAAWLQEGSFILRFSHLMCGDNTCLT